MVSNERKQYFTFFIPFSLHVSVGSKLRSHLRKRVKLRIFSQYWNSKKQSKFVFPHEIIQVIIMITTFEVQNGRYVYVVFADNFVVLIVQFTIQNNQLLLSVDVITYSIIVVHMMNENSILSFSNSDRQTLEYKL